MRILTLPGVFPPHSDTWLLVRAVVDLVRERPGASVLELCTGSGAVAIAAAREGAMVTATDVSRRAVACATVNAQLNGVRVRARRGDLLDPVGDQRFDAIVANPPYVPTVGECPLPSRGAARAWDAGRDGRAVLARLCAEALAHLRPGGALLLVHSAICDTDATLRSLRDAGLRAGIAVRSRGPLGPLMSARAPALERRGALARGVREEEIVVVRGVRS